MQGYGRIISGQRYAVTSDVFVGWTKGEVVKVISVNKEEQQQVTVQRIAVDATTDVSWRRMSTSLFRAMFNRVPAGGAA